MSKIERKALTAVLVAVIAAIIIGLAVGVLIGGIGLMIEPDRSEWQGLVPLLAGVVAGNIAAFVAYLAIGLVRLCKVIPGHMRVFPIIGFVISPGVSLVLGQFIGLFAAIPVVGVIFAAVGALVGILMPFVLVWGGLRIAMSLNKSSTPSEPPHEQHLG